MPQDITFMWNLKQKQKQTKKKDKTTKIITTENKLVVARDGNRGWMKWVKGVKRYKLRVIN